MPASLPSRKDYLILVVDDDEASRNAMQLLLELDGFRVVTAGDGQEGLERLHAGLQPMAILIDLSMPRMDGFEFLAAQKQHARLAEIPVVVYSAQPPNHDRRAALKPAGWFEKPFDVDRVRLMFAQLRSALAARHGER